MYKYQNESDATLTITTSGNINPRVVGPGETVESDVEINNPNFKLISGPAESNNVRGDTAGVQPNAVIQAKPAQPQSAPVEPAQNTNEEDK